MFSFRQRLLIAEQRDQYDAARTGMSMSVVAVAARRILLHW